MKRCILVMMGTMVAFGAIAADTVRVAAVQCPSVMGKTEANLRNITHLVRKAASQGAKIVVMPECAVRGYLDPTTWTSPTSEQSWPGRGHSCVITREGKVLAMSEAVSGNDIVLADLEIRKGQNHAYPKRF